MVRQHPQWDTLSQDAVDKWRSDDVTLAFVDELREMNRQNQRSLMNMIERGGDGRVMAGSIRAVEAILDRIFEVSEKAPPPIPEEPFRDPADVIEENA